MIFTNVFDSIEGEKLSIQCRKFNPYPPRREKIFNKLVYPFKLTIFGKAIIEEELIPKCPVFNKDSHLDLYDELRGESINCFSTKLVSAPIVSAATGSHRANFIHTRGYTYAHIEVSLRALTEQKDKN